MPIVQVMTIADANSLFLWSPTRGYCTIPSTTPNLSQLIKQRADDNSFFSDEELGCFAVQIGAALNILHGGGKVPVNIKTQDIFIENNKTIKIASVPMFVSAAHNPDTELLKEEDLFDLGCIFLEMIDLRKPRSNDAERIIAAEICNNPSQAEMSPLASALRQLGCKMVSTAIPSSRPSAGTVFMTLLTTVTKAPPIHKAFKEIGVFSLIYKCLLQNGTFQYFYEIWDAVTRLIESKDDAQLFLDSKLLELGTTNFVVMYEDMITGCGKLPLAPLKSGSSDDGRNVFRINTFTGIVTSLFLYCNVMRDFPHLEALLTLNVVPTLTNVLDQYSITVQSRESETHLDIFAFACSILLSLILLPGNRTAPAQPNMFFEHFKDTDCLPVLLKLFGILNQFISSHSLSSSSSTPPYNSFHIQTRVYVAVIIACLLKGKRPDVAAFPHGEMHAAVMAALFFLSGLHGHPLPPEIQDDEVGEYVGNAWTGVVDGDTVLKEYNEKK